jgi:hypothetical protein
MKQLGVTSLSYPERDNMARDYRTVHVSEWAWIGSDFDFIIRNESSFADLEETTKNMLQFFENSDIL